jgi:hypothetical protein
MVQPTTWTGYEQILWLLTYPSSLQRCSPQLQKYKQSHEHRCLQVRDHLCWCQRKTVNFAGSLRFQWSKTGLVEICWEARGCRMHSNKMHVFTKNNMSLASARQRSKDPKLDKWQMGERLQLHISQTCSKNSNILYIVTVVMVMQWCSHWSAYPCSAHLQYVHIFFTRIHV